MYHKVSLEQLNVIMEVKTLNYLIVSENLRGCRLAWSRLRDLGSRDPGSNPGSPTILSYLMRSFLRKCLRIIDEF